MSILDSFKYLAENFSNIYLFDIYYYIKISEKKEINVLI